MSDNNFEDKTFNISLGTLATKWERLGASIVDAIFIYIITFLLSFVGLKATGQISGSSIYLTLIVSSLWPYFIYFPITTIIWGGTPGKVILRMKVVSNTYEPLSPGLIYLRESIGKLIGHIMFGALWLFFNSRNKTAWDYIASSLVVKKV